ncbi:chain-length determining protein [Arthrobacter sp. NPDC058288]|uniref:chain-length determining protein n=1 Tax=Arthrobacter sp. NPDC058288 TaxID=3346424 RepID=UPI0036EB8FCE
MDPISVIKTLWRHKWVAMPVVVLTIAACVYVMFIGQRTYQATMTYALVTPKVPTALELQNSPELAKVNGDNPYLRSPDSSLLSQVVITKLGAQETAKSLRERGLGTEYTVSQASSFGSGMLLELRASGTSPEQAVDTAVALGNRLTTTLHDVQKINGADESYLFSALPVEGPGQAEEMFSSRLRTLIIVALGGVVLVFGAVSTARSLELASAGRRVREKPAKRAAAPDVETRELPGPVSGTERRQERVDVHPPRDDLAILDGSLRIPVPDRERRT